MRAIRTFFYFSAVLFLSGSFAAAQPVTLKNAAEHFTFLNSEGKINDTIEASGIEAVGTSGKYVLVVNDDAPEILVVELQTKRIVKTLSIPSDPLQEIPAFGSGKNNPKWEGLSRDTENNYYVIGAHTKPRESYLIRFRIENDISDDASQFTVSGVIRLNMNARLKELFGKVKIEGMAIKTVLTADQKIAEKTLLIGLREPANPARVLRADITNVPEKTSKNLSDLRCYFSFEAGRSNNVDFQLSSLTYARAWKGFLALTSTESPQNTFHGNALWFIPEPDVKDSAEAKVCPAAVSQKVWTFGLDAATGRNLKAEGIFVLPDQTPATISAGVVYDNDGNKDSSGKTIPSTYQQITLAR
jgi:hypothetical protein